MGLNGRYWPSGSSPRYSSPLACSRRTLKSTNGKGRSSELVTYPSPQSPPTPSLSCPSFRKPQGNGANGSAKDFVFLSIDWLGALFSIMSLVAQRTFDYLGGVLYLVVILLESGIFISHWIWLLRTRKQRKAAAADSASTKSCSSVSGKSGDDVTQV